MTRIKYLLLTAICLVCAQAYGQSLLVYHVVGQVSYRVNGVSKPLVMNTKVKVQITGMADALPFRRTVAYDGCYGDFDQEPVYKNDELSNITVTEATGISENEQLAYLRAMGVKDYLDRNIPAFGKMRTTFDTYIEVSQNKGGAYRRIGVKLTFVDAL